MLSTIFKYQSNKSNLALPLVFIELKLDQRIILHFFARTLYPYFILIL